jgi:hypothetical protein
MAALSTIHAVTGRGMRYLWSGQSLCTVQYTLYILPLGIYLCAPSSALILSEVLFHRSYKMNITYTCRIADSVVFIVYSQVLYLQRQANMYSI